MQTAPNPSHLVHPFSLIAHELVETVTDPLGNAWYDSANNECADKVAGAHDRPRCRAPPGPRAVSVLGVYVCVGCGCVLGVVGCVLGVVRECVWMLL